MTAHLLRLIWNRKRQNVLLSFEILLSFLVLFGVSVVGLQYLARWNAPLGFQTDDVWTVEIRRPPEQSAAEAALRAREMLTGLRAMPNVESAAGVFILPYSGSSAISGLPLPDGRYIPYSFGQGTDELDEVLKMRLVSGRWFNREDDGTAEPPVLLNRRLAREIFGAANPVGRTIYQVQQPNTPPIPPRLRVVGVIEDFRHDELAAPANFAFFRLEITGAAGGPDEGPLLSGLPGDLAIRVTPGTTSALEESLVRRLEAIAPGWTFRLDTLSDARRETLTASLAPLAIAAIVTSFLLTMVALGLTGVVWQSITTRTPEFALRRANGATASAVWLQILSELVLLTSLAIAVGIAVVAQLPLLPAEPLGLSLPPMQVWAWSIAVSAGVIYLLTLLCGLYPSRLATRIQPADALRYE